MHGRYRTLERPKSTYMDHVAPNTRLRQFVCCMWPFAPLGRFHYRRFSPYLILNSAKFSIKSQTSVTRNAIRETSNHYRTHGGLSGFALSTRTISVIFSQGKYVNDIRVQKWLHISREFVARSHYGGPPSKLATTRARYAATQYLSRLNFLNRQKPGTDASTYWRGRYCYYQ